jgi:hypothetical protein
MHLVFGHDNDSFMLGPHTRKAQTDSERVYFDWRFTAADGGPHPACCICCGRRTDRNFIDPSFRVARRRFDLSSTYDGYTVASSRFREACQGEHGAGLEFVAIPSDPAFFIVRANRSLTVNRELSDLQLFNPCPTCREFAGVIGVSDLQFLDADPDAVGFWHTDLAFGEAHDQSPVLVVGMPTAKWLREKKFKGADLSPLPA